MDGPVDNQAMQTPFVQQSPVDNQAMQTPFGQQPAAPQAMFGQEQSAPGQQPYVVLQPGQQPPPGQPCVVQPGQLQQPAMQQAMQPAMHAAAGHAAAGHAAAAAQQQQPPKDLTALQICACYSLCCPCGTCTGLFCYLQNKDDPDQGVQDWAQYNGMAGCCNCFLSVLAAASGNTAAATTALGAAKTALASKTATVAPAMVTMA